MNKMTAQDKIRTTRKIQKIMDATNRPIHEIITEAVELRKKYRYPAETAIDVMVKKYCGGGK